MESFVVIGLGRFGMTLARELYRLGHEVLAVDKDEEAVPRVSDSMPGMNRCSNPSACATLIMRWWHLSTISRTTSSSP